MNRYLIAALYVMAGCAVTIPLKAQGSSESLRGDRCRLVITNTVKAISIYMEQNEEDHDFCNSLPPDYFHFPHPEISIIDFSCDETILINAGPLCRISYKIRAPEIEN